MEHRIDDKDNVEGRVPQDNYLEHELHIEYDKQCSTCFNLLRGIEATNAKQESGLAKLRASIQAQRDLFLKDEPKATEKKLLELCTVPEITADNNVEFNLERYTQLCTRVDVLYHNYLARKSRLDSDDEQTFILFEGALSEMCGCFDALVEEGLKVRFS